MNIFPEIDWVQSASVLFPDSQANGLGMTAVQDYQFPINGLLKRTMDILITLLLGLIFLPVFLLTAMLVRLDSPGPIFYSQQRLGKNGRKIIIYKFRSMRCNADHLLMEYLRNCPSARFEWEKTQKLRCDPRLTRVGKWIREFSLDELPQLFNILKGDMSLVGPRPILLDQEELYGLEINIYLMVRPGLTGFWQVSGRNHTTFFQRTLYDAYYIRNWSVWLDIIILLRTVWVVLSRDGAY